MTLPCTAIVRAHLQGAFERQYRYLHELYGIDLCDEIVLDELADFLHSATLGDLTEDDTIEECCAALEEMCRTDGIDPIATVYDHVLSALPATALERLRSYLGPVAAQLLDQMEAQADAEALDLGT